MARARTQLRCCSYRTHEFGDNQQPPNIKMDYTEFKRFAAHAGGSFMPVLGDVHVYATPLGNRAQIGNGRYWVDTPCELPVMTVNAERLSASLLACKGTPKVTVTGDAVSVTSGRVRAKMQVSSNEYPLAAADPPSTQQLPGVVDVLVALEPFVATDASRAWATSVCLSGAFAYATNNAVVVRCPLAVSIEPPVNIPVSVIQAAKERGDVVAFGHTDRSVTFHYADGSWVRTLLIAGDWPTKAIDGLVGGLPADGWLPVHEDLEQMLLTANKLSPERNPVVQFGAAGLSLVDGSFEVDGLEPLPEAGRVSAKMAALVFSGATHVQWHTPKQDVHAFRCENYVGVLGGQK